MGIREKSYYYTLQVRNGDQTAVRDRKAELIKADMWIRRWTELDEQVLDEWPERTGGPSTMQGFW